ncbi:hypothetical protein Ahy_B10g101402 [Arachis hypogaea]|uniref:PB1-like domain-containing protein n=1 Tax=Arachis hypogaea TaxID=3818 RepID=A0A444WZR2_ARAHY|nr:hypothetical protein Ahy_B10g101402 [Arachis hypogaea]
MPVLHGDAVDEGLLDELLELRRELGPVAGDLLAEEDGGELADVGGLGGTEVVNEGGDHLGVLSEALDLVLCLTAGVVVGHEELNQQELQRLRHLSLVLRIERWREWEALRMDVHLDIMFHHGKKFQKDENGMTIYSPNKKTCVGDIDVDTLDIFWVRNYYKELRYDRIGECWWHIPGRSLDSGLRALNCDDELREMCFMGKKNDVLVDVYFEHAVSTPKILDENEIVVYVEGDHDDLREVSDEADNEPLQDKIPKKTNIPTAPADETPFTNNNEPTHNTSPP